MKVRDVPPSIKRLFPWGLFLVCAAIFFYLAMITRPHAEDDVWACYASARYQAMSSGWPPCSEMSTLCLRVREYLNSHTVAQARAEALARHIPHWIVAKAERCVPNVQ